MPANAIAHRTSRKARHRAGAAIFLLLVQCLGNVPPSLAEEHSLTILHSSEHHGQALPIEERGKPRMAGMAGRAALIADIKQSTANILLVDSGDILIGTPLSTFFRGEPDIKAMNLMGYQAMAAGNHEFDFGLDHFAKLSDLAQFPILCSNLASAAASLPCRPSAVVQAGGLKIGLISLLGSKNFPDTFNPEVVKVFSFRDPLETARALARKLKAADGADLVVAVTHQETDEDLAVLAQVPEVDVIIGGHTEGFDGLRTAGSTTPVEEAAEPGPILVKTHRLGRTLGRLDLSVMKQAGGKDAKILSARAKNLPVTEQLAPAQAVGALLADYAAQLESKTAEVVGRSLVHLDGDMTHVRTQETTLGNLLADLVRSEFGTDIALINGGVIRDSIPPGPVEIKRLLRVVPFDSPIVTFTVTGKQLLLALENSVSRLPGTGGRFLQVSGMTVVYDASASTGKRVRKVTVGGKPLETERRYSVATDAFLADGGDGYAVFTESSDRLDRQLPLRDLLLAALRIRPLKASLDGRIRFVGPATEPAAPPHAMPQH